jgi:hypothetical protein
MAVFTLNWYLYKTHFNETYESSQIRNSRTATEDKEPEKVSALQILREIDDEF